MAKPEPMNGFEYQRFYDTGMMPERFWPKEIAKMQENFGEGKIDLHELEDGLEAMMGFPA